MIFRIDKQTTDDLGIFGKNNDRSVYGIFNKTVTSGGSQVLEEMFRYPLSEDDKINERGRIIRFFQENKIAFPFKSELFDPAESYLANTDNRTRLSAYQDNLERKFRSAIGSDTEYKQIAKGVASIVEIICVIDNFLKGIPGLGPGCPYYTQASAMRDMIDSDALKSSLQEKNPNKITYARTAEFDQIFRFSSRDMVKQLLQLIYQLDVYISVAGYARERNFAYAEAMQEGAGVFEIEGLYHPLLKNAVPNSIKVDQKSNMIFLTGANMAGKSTFMKSFGIAVYLAHMGFPVPAASMKFSVLNGMFTTINLPDNINKGYSHFYAEVVRVRKVAESIGNSKNLLVIFDELFRGTNVKDAYDATVAVSEAFAANKNCIFIISTHIIEAGETLKESCDNINFINLPTIMDGNVPRYTYRIEKGITSDRHGMIIVKNEGILDILNKQ
jgi:DNA mismatch repair ATPase MutS